MYPLNTFPLFSDWANHLLAMCHMLWFTLMDEFRAQIWRHQSSQVRSQRCTFKPGSGLSFRPLQNFTHFPHWLLLQDTCVTVSCWQRANYYTVFPEFLNHEDSVFVKLPQGKFYMNDVHSMLSLLDKRAGSGREKFYALVWQLSLESNIQFS